MLKLSWELLSTSEDLVQANMEALSGPEESFSHTQWHAALGQDMTQLPHS